MPGVCHDGGDGATSCGADLLAAAQPQVFILQTEAWPADLARLTAFYRSHQPGARITVPIKFPRRGILPDTGHYPLPVQ